jgi:hypothetical protein
MSREKLMSLPCRNASISSATRSISIHVEGIDSENDVLTTCLAETSELESKIRQIFGWP